MTPIPWAPLLCMAGECAGVYTIGLWNGGNEGGKQLRLAIRDILLYNQTERPWAYGKEKGR